MNNQSIQSNFIHASTKLPVQMRNMLVKCSRKNDNLCIVFLIILFSRSATAAPGNGSLQHKKKQKKQKTLVISCVGYDDEAVRIYGRRGNFKCYVAQWKRIAVSFNTIPVDRWAANVHHQGTGSRSQVSASVKGTIWILTRARFLVMGGMGARSAQRKATLTYMQTLQRKDKQAHWDTNHGPACQQCFTTEPILMLCS